MTRVGTPISGRLVGRRIDQIKAYNNRGIAQVEDSALGVVATSSSLDGVVRKKLAKKLLKDPGIRFGDGSFYLPTVEQVRAILKASEADRRTWMAERFDCDDFAYVLKGEMSVHAYAHGELRFALCVGMVWGNFDWVDGYHAVNWFVANDGELQFVEPQDDTIYDASHCLGQISLLLV